MSHSWPAGVNVLREELGEDFDKLTLDTKIATSRAKPLQNCDPVVVPIYHSSNYRFKTVEQFTQKNHGNNHVYSREGNPTVENVEVILSEIEGSAATLLYNSGLAAISAVLWEFLSQGDHMVCMVPIYSGSHSFMTKTLARFGVEITFVDLDKEKDFSQKVKQSVKKNTKLVFLEVIANPSMTVPDVPAIIDIAKEAGLRVAIDSTFASPYLFHPIQMGADISIHSCSKYVGGHSDVIAGCVSLKVMEDWQRLKMQQLTTGSSLGPQEAALLARGLKTLAIRMEKICENAEKVATFLDKHPKVAHTFYPGLPSHPHHKNAIKSMKKFGGMIAFDMGSEENAIEVVENVRIIVFAVSLGGTESLIEHPYSMTASEEESTQSGGKEEAMVVPGLIRLSIGLENADDLIKDLERALEKVEL